MLCPGLGGLRRGYSLWEGGAPPSPPGSVPPWITSGFSWSRVGLAKWFIRMQGSDTSRLACFFKDLQSILWQCFTWKARYCNASLLLSPLSLSPQPYLSSTSGASSFCVSRIFFFFFSDFLFFFVFLFFFQIFLCFFGTFWWLISRGL